MKRTLLLLLILLSCYVLPTLTAVPTITVIPAPREIQGPSECVGYAWAAMLHSSLHPRPDANGHEIYTWSKAVDGEPDKVGTHVQTAAQELIKRGYLLSVTYTFDTNLAAYWVTHVGPVVASIDWTSGMETPYGDILVPTGSHAYYHAVMCYGYDGEYFACQDSEGAEEFRMRAADLGQVIYDTGIALPTN